MFIKWLDHKHQWHRWLLDQPILPFCLNYSKYPEKPSIYIPKTQFIPFWTFLFDRNIVSTVNLNCKLDLKKIALHARNAEYNPKRFAAVIMRIREPRTTALIFSSGKMVCTGAKSEEDSRLAARKYARIIQKLGFTAKFLDFKIQNMVGSCDVKFPIRLEGLVLTHAKFSSYEPELFPGLIYRMVKPRIVLLIFVSGKVVLTGAKVRQEIYDAFDQIYPILKSFKKQCWRRRSRKHKRKSAIFVRIIIHTAPFDKSLASTQGLIRFHQSISFLIVISLD